METQVYVGKTVGGNVGGDAGGGEPSGRRGFWEESADTLARRILGLDLDERDALRRGRIGEALALSARRRGLQERRQEIELELVRGPARG